MAKSRVTNWYFTKEQLESTPSRECGIDAYKELAYRQQAASFILDMGQRLKVSLLCINTAIVYMHRFYVFHSFTHFPGSSIAAAALFLAAKVEEQPRKLEHLIRAANYVKRQEEAVDPNSERYKAQSQELVSNENILLQTLGFEVAIDHPHTHVVKCCHLVKASKELAQTSYIIASNSLHLTMMCLRYKPTVVACFCIHFVCKWTNWEIPLSNEKKVWYSYVDESVTAELLEQLASEFLNIYERCPNRLKTKINAVSNVPPDQNGIHGINRLHHLLDGASAKAAEASSSSQMRERDHRDRREPERIAHHNLKGVHPNIPSSSGLSGASGSNSATSSKHGLPHHSHHEHSAQSSDSKLRHPHPSSSGSHSSSNVARIDVKEMRETMRNSREQLHNKDSASAVKDSGIVSNNNANNSNHAIRPHSSDKHSDYPSHLRQDPKMNPNKNESLRGSQVDANKRLMQTVDPKLQQRRREDFKPHGNNKLESDVKKHLNTISDKPTNMAHNKITLSASKSQSTSNGSQRNRSPHIEPITKQTSVPSVHSYTNSKNLELQHNGNMPNFSSISHSSETIKRPLDMHQVSHATKERITSEQNQSIKRPGLFSPDSDLSPPKKKPKVESNSPGKREHLLKISEAAKLQSNNGTRSRTSSNNSEPELRPVLKKIDQIEGFEHIVRDSSIGIKLNEPTDGDHDLDIQVSIAKELKPPDMIMPFNKPNSVPITQAQPILNGIETNPTLISSLLKETPVVSSFRTVNDTDNEKKIHDSKEPQKKLKSKKEKHKHKNKEDKEKKKRHKDKDRHKHKKESSGGDSLESVPPTPIKITIDKKKMQQVVEPPTVMPGTSSGGGLKIKIPKEKLKTDGISESKLKIKISKDHINNMFIDKSRDNERSSLSETGNYQNKASKLTQPRHSDIKSNRNNYDKVTGDGEASLHRLAESKYINKGATT